MRLTIASMQNSYPILDTKLRLENHTLPHTQNEREKEKKTQKKNNESTKLKVSIHNRPENEDVSRDSCVTVPLTSMSAPRRFSPVMLALVESKPTLRPVQRVHAVRINERAPSVTFGGRNSGKPRPHLDSATATRLYSAPHSIVYWLLNATIGFNHVQLLSSRLAPA